jgi:hypothetical protein
MKTCLICANGPSFADIRNDVLDRFDTFGGNRIYLKYEPTYYVFVDPFIGRTNWLFIEEINTLKSEKFIVEEFAIKIAGSHPLNCIHRKGFSQRPLEYIYTYFSVTTAMIQLAFWKGYDRVGLVGLDHRYNEPNGKREWHQASQDRNHFAPDYYKGYLDNWKAPRMDLLEEWFDLARTIFEADGRQIINLTPNSGCKAFQTDRLENWI